MLYKSPEFPLRESSAPTHPPQTSFTARRGFHHLPALVIAKSCAAVAPVKDAYTSDAAVLPDRLQIPPLSPLNSPKPYSVGPKSDFITPETDKHSGLNLMDGPGTLRLNGGDKVDDSQAVTKEYAGENNSYFTSKADHERQLLDDKERKTYILSALPDVEMITCLARKTLSSRRWVIPIVNLVSAAVAKRQQKMLKKDEQIDLFLLYMKKLSATDRKSSECQKAVEIEKFLTASTSELKELGSATFKKRLG